MRVRKNIRIEVQLGVSFKIEGAPAETSFTGTTRNISRCGVCIIASDRKQEIVGLLEQRTPRVQVSIYLKNDRKLVDVNVKTAWISSKVGWFVTPQHGETPVLFGASFEDIGPEDRSKIDGFINGLLQEDASSLEEISKRITRRLSRPSGAKP